MITNILIILGLILLNGVFAMSELAVVQARRARLEKLSEDGSAGARSALQLADDPSRLLSTVQVGITLISIFNGAFGEASLVAQLTPQLQQVPAVAAFAREVSLGIVVVGITFASIVLGELVPKRIAIRHPEVIATMIAAPLILWSRIMAPFVKILSVTTDFIMRLLGMHRPLDTAPTQEEITGVLREGTDAGVLEKAEFDIASRAVRLTDQRLKTLMTPRADLDYIDLNDALERNLEKIAASPYSRFPVYGAERTKVLGIVHAGDLFEQAIRSGCVSGVDIAAATKPALYVPESLSPTGLLEAFKQNRTEVALIVDEYGETEGMVTISDVMGALVGNVPMNDEAVEDPDAVRREDGSWFMDGTVPLGRFRELLDVQVVFPDEASGTYHTLAGFALHQLQHIPKQSESFEWEGFRFEMADMDGIRIDRVLVSRVEAADPAPAEEEPGA